MPSIKFLIEVGSDEIDQGMIEGLGLDIKTAIEDCFVADVISITRVKDNREPIG